MTSLSPFALTFVTTLTLLAGCGGKVVVDGTGLEGAGGAGTTAGTGAGGSTGSGLPEIVCGPKQLGIQGSLEGELLSYSVPISGASFVVAGLKVFGTETGGQLIFNSSSDPGDDGLHTDLAWIGIPILPPEEQSPLSNHAGLWLCQAPGPTITIPPESLSLAPVTFSALRALGTCPGKPVSGDLKLCQPSQSSCMSGDIYGTVDGQEVHATFAGAFNNESVYAGGGVLVPGSGLGPSVFIVPAGNPDAGALYCVGSAGPEGLSDLSRLGTCAEAAPIAGALAVCFGL